MLSRLEYDVAGRQILMPVVRNAWQILIKYCFFLSPKKYQAFSGTLKKPSSFEKTRAKFQKRKKISPKTLELELLSDLLIV